ncbi:MAG TPA: hypothetical protein VLM17_04185 [Xanthomonadaceae bacterium]|nr:hypothetical protein [Xanthomonadaceae bacterium]
MDCLQENLRQTAAALLLEAGASAVAVALDEDPDGYWIAVGPKSHIPFLFGCANASNAAKADELARQSARVANMESRRLQ